MVKNASSIGELMISVNTCHRVEKDEKGKRGWSKVLKQMMLFLPFIIIQTRALLYPSR
jgi:hypothetical protein